MAAKQSSDDPTLPDDLRLEIVAAARRLGVSQKSVAIRAGLTQSQLSRYLRNRSDIRTSALLRILDCLNLDVAKTLGSQSSTPLQANTNRLSPLAMNVALLVDSVDDIHRSIIARFVVRYCNVNQHRKSEKVC